MPTKAAERLLGIFCPVHNTDFTVNGAGTLVCPTGQHTLAENFPYDKYWDYCCNCQRFYLSELNQGRTVRSTCPNCERKINHWYLCESCKTITTESDEPAGGKQFSLLDGWRPLPCCPGCQLKSESVLMEHICDAISDDERDLTVVFTTTLKKCPFCKQETDERRLTQTRAQLARPSAGVPRKPSSQPLIIDVETPRPDAPREARRAWLKRFLWPQSKKEWVDFATVAGLFVSLVALLCAFGFYLFPNAPAYAWWWVKGLANHNPVLKPIECPERRVYANEEVHLKAIADDEAKEKLVYKWSASDGLIESHDAEAVLKTLELKTLPTSIEVSVDVKDEYGRISSEKTNIYVSLNQPPYFRLKPGAAEVQAGENVSLEAIVKDDQKPDELKYEWGTSAGQIIGSGANVTLSTSGVHPQTERPITANVTLTVDDRRGGIASNNQLINIYRNPLAASLKTAPAAPVIPANNSPRLSQLQPLRNPVFVGEEVQIQADVDDPDNDNLVYEWEIPDLELRRVNTSPSLVFNTAGMKLPAEGSNLMVRLTVRDNHGGSASLKTTVSVKSPPLPAATPQSMSTPADTVAGQKKPR